MDVGSIYDQSVKTYETPVSVTKDEFKNRVGTLMTRLSSDPALANILHGNVFPYLIPRTGAIEDMGQFFLDKWVGMVQRSFSSTDPQHSMTNHYKGSASGCMNLRQGTRHEALLKKLETEDVVGLYIPCLTEYSIPAAIERLQTLSEDLILSGALDLSAALIGNPLMLLNKKCYPPLLWISSYDATGDLNFHFEAYGYNLAFNRRPQLDQVAEYWWNGISLIG
jgi:hypothetical protein